MKRFYFLGGFFSTLIIACFLVMTPVSSAEINIPQAGLIERMFGRNNNQDDRLTVARIQSSKDLQNNCALTLCTLTPPNQETLRVCQDWANQTFGQTDCAYVDAAVNTEYRCIDQYRCLPNPNQTNISRESRIACDAVLQQEFKTLECTLLEPSLISDAFKQLSEPEKRQALEIQNHASQMSCIQTMCSHQSGGTVRASELRICNGWSDLLLGTTSCSDLRRVFDDGSIEARSYRMTQEDEFTCVAAICGEAFVQISPEEERFCQDWAQTYYGTNQCEALLDAYAPNQQREDNGSIFGNLSISKRMLYRSWQQNNANGNPAQEDEENNHSQNPLSALPFLVLRDANQLSQCIPFLLGQEIDQNSENADITEAACRYLARQYDFYDEPTPADLTQCLLMGIVPGVNQNQNDQMRNIEHIRCQYWLTRAQTRGEQIEINQNIRPDQENAQVNTPELFFKDVNFENGIYTVTIGNSGFIPESPLEVVLSARWIYQEEGWQSHREDFVAHRFMLQPRSEREWVFEVRADALSRAFPPEHAGSLEFTIDPNNAIAERNENNNGWAVAPRPDFQMLNIGNSEIVRTGVIPVVIKNQAPRSVHEAGVPFFFQWIGNQGQTVSSFDTMALMVARNQRYQTDVVVREIPDQAVGFRITINHNHRIPEMSYQNNTYEYFFAPDLVIDQVITQKNSIVARVRNIGNTSIDLADFDVQATWMSQQGIRSESTAQTIRQQGDENEWIVRFPLSSAPKDANFIRLIVDHESMVNETNESNNTAEYALNDAGMVAIAQHNNQSEEQRGSENVGILPDSGLYKIKEAWRSFRLGVTFNPSKKAQYMLDIAELRQNERLEAIRQGKNIPDDLPSPLPLDKFLAAVKNIPVKEADQKQEFLKKSLAHIEFEYQPLGAEPIVFEYEENPNGREAEPIVFEYLPKPEQREQFSVNFLKVMNAAEGELNKRLLLETLSEKDFGSAQKHIQTSLKLSALAEKSSEQIKPLVLSEQTELTKKISESLKQETPAQQKLLLDVVPVTEKTLDQTKMLIQTLSEEVQDETLKKSIFAPKFLEIEALQKTGSSLPDTSKTITVIPPTLTTTTTSTLTPPITCQDDGQIVCGKDGKTYTSTCAAQKANVIVVSRGKCAEVIIDVKPPEIIIIKPTTTLEVPPVPVNDCSKSGTKSVCGANGKTYSNSCYAQKDGVKVISNGACPTITLTPPPECTSTSGCDDKNSCTQNACVNGKCVYTPYNDCGTDEYSCTDGIDNDRNGKIDCADNACSSLSFCTPVSTCDDNEPVCGRDGITYTSECVAEAKGVMVDSYGKCPITQINTFDTTNIKTLDTNTFKVPTFTY
jgi:hypothetical protein